jgi:LacI family transcriptional regulator
MKTNLRALSHSLGLSPTTVSRALAGYPDVSDATRQRVVAAAAAAGYQPDSTARRLATGRAEAVGLVYPFSASGLGDPRFVEVVAGIAEGLGDAHLDLMIVAARTKSELDTYRRLTAERRVDVLIVANTLLDDPRIRLLQARRFPFVAYGRTNSPEPYAWFDFDNEAGARMAVERLVALGHRRIGLIHGPLSVTFAAQRHAGFVKAVRAAGVALDPAWVREAALTRTGGYEAMRGLLALTDPPSGVIVDNNLGGVGAVRALDDAGKRPGRELSLIVYDGVPADIPLPYRVTSVTQGSGEATGRAIAKLVIGTIANSPVEDLRRLDMPQIEAGETDAPVR